MKSPKAPAPPDPVAQVKAESEANRYNIAGPGGSQTWSTDSAGRATQNVQLGESEQRQYDTQNRIAEAMLGRGADFAAKGPGEYSDLPEFGSKMSNMGDFSLKGSNGPEAQAEYARQMAFLEPDFERSNRAFDQKMSNAGLPVGSEAYNDAMSQNTRDQNFAREQAARGATSLGSNLALQERGQQFGEASAADTQTSANRGQLMSEDLAKRQQMYNEIAASLGSDQLAPVGSYGGSGPQLNTSGAYDQYNTAVNNRYNQQQARANNVNGGLMALGSAALMASDVRVKEDIEQVGDLPTGEGVYEFNYTGKFDDGERHTGVMAQEVEQSQPDAVMTGADGVKRVDYRKVLARAMAAAA